MKKRLFITVFIVLTLQSMVIWTWQVRAWNWLLMDMALMGITITENDFPQEQGAAYIGRRGGPETVIPMIKAVRNTREENGLVENLLQLDKRYPLTEEPYLSLIVDSILSPDTKCYNRYLLVNVLERVTGEEFHFPAATLVEKKKIKRVWSIVDPPPEEVDKSLALVSKWWIEKKKSEHSGKPLSSNLPSG